jgi:hypothetical protein
VDAWDEVATTTHQDHVIAHVIDTTVFGYLVLEDAIHLLLDIGFIWKIYVDGEMGLLPHPVATAELDVTEELRAKIKVEIDLLLRDGASAAPLINFLPLTTAYLITAVHIFCRNEELKFVIEGEAGNVEIRTSTTDHKIRVTEETTST